MAKPKYQTTPLATTLTETVDTDLDRHCCLFGCCLFVGDGKKENKSRLMNAESGGLPHSGSGRPFGVKPESRIVAELAECVRTDSLNYVPGQLNVGPISPYGRAFIPRHVVSPDLVSVSAPHASSPSFESDARLLAYAGIMPLVPGGSQGSKVACLYSHKSHYIHDSSLFSHHYFIHTHLIFWSSTTLCIATRHDHCCSVPARCQVYRRWCLVRHGE